jgi:hypothetical protein
LIPITPPHTPRSGARSRSIARRLRRVRLLLDGKMIAAPIVRSSIANEAIISGTTENLDRVLLLLKK